MPMGSLELPTQLLLGHERPFVRPQPQSPWLEPPWQLRPQPPWLFAVVQVVSRPCCRFKQMLNLLLKMFENGSNVGMCDFLGDFQTLCNNNSHFHTFHLNTPRISSLVETRLHDMGNCLALTKDLCQIFSTEHISESRSC